MFLVLKQAKSLNNVGFCQHFKSKPILSSNLASTGLFNPTLPIGASQRQANPLSGIQTIIAT